MPTSEREWVGWYRKQAGDLAGFPGTRHGLHLCELLEAAWSREAALEARVREWNSDSLGWQLRWRQARIDWRKAGSTIRRLRAERDAARASQIRQSNWLRRLGAERDAARAAGYHEALDAVKHMLQIAGRWDDGLPVAMELLYSRYPCETREDDWWCPKCQAWLVPEQVTYIETHATCGTPVEWRETREEADHG